jgi:glycosyltransferase involved in cell wall biosynthesis
LREYSKMHTAISGGAMKRHLVYMVGEFEPATGGTTTQIRTQAKEALKRGWRVTVLTRRLANVRGFIVNVEGIDVRRVGVSGLGPVAKLTYLVCAWVWLARRKGSISVVNAILDADYAVIASLTGLGTRTTVTWVTRGDPGTWLSGFIGKGRSRTLKPCKQVSLTNTIRMELESLAQHVDDTIPVPIDLDRFYPPSAEEKQRSKNSLGLTSEFVIVFSGHLERRKAVDLLLKGFVKTIAAGWDATLIILGGERSNEVSYAREVVDYAVGALPTERVIFFGAVADVAPFLFAADLFCLPSWREGMPNSILEAMACGLTCIAPASAGGDELLQEGAGIIPQSNSPDELAGAIESALADPILRFRLSREAARRVEERNSISNVMDRYERLWTPE